MSEEQSVQPRGQPNAEELKAAKLKYKVYDNTAAIAYDLLRRDKRKLTPNDFPREHARLVHLSYLKQKKGKL